MGRSARHLTLAERSMVSVLVLALAAVLTTRPALADGTTSVSDADHRACVLAADLAGELSPSDTSRTLNNDALWFYSHRGQYERSSAESIGPLTLSSSAYRLPLLDLAPKTSPPRCLSMFLHT